MSKHIFFQRFMASNPEKLTLVFNFVSHFRQVDVKIPLIYLLTSIFIKLSEINFSQKLLKFNHNIINIYFITNEGNDILIKYIILMILIFIEPIQNNNQRHLDVKMCLLPNVGCL